MQCLPLCSLLHLVLTYTFSDTKAVLKTNLYQQKQLDQQWNINKKPQPVLDAVAVQGLSIGHKANKPGSLATAILHLTADVLKQK